MNAFCFALVFNIKSKSFPNENITHGKVWSDGDKFYEDSSSTPSVTIEWKVNEIHDILNGIIMKTFINSST